MKRRVWASVCAVLWALGLAAGASAADVPPPADGQAVIETTVEALRGALAADPALTRGERPDDVVELVARHVLPHVDEQTSGRMILGRYWREASPEQRRRFIDGYRDLLLRTYATHATDYLNAEVEILSSALAGTKGKVLQVRTRVTRPGKPVASVDYRMIARSGEWKVFDAVVQGVSLVSTLRNAVAQEIQRHGIDGLNARLEAKVADAALAPPAAVTH